MTKQQAEHESARLSAEHPDRDRARWRPREEPDGSWSVVRIALAPIDDTLQAETRAEERPPTADDPRSPGVRDVGGPWVGPA
jgi:hypothetical protein